MNNLTQAEKDKFCLILEARFPWLLDSDEDANGADVVDELSELHTELKKPRPHNFIGVGHCSVCGHYGSDCTGKKKQRRKSTRRARRDPNHEDTPSLQDRGIFMPDYSS